MTFVFSLLQSITLSKPCYTKISLVFGSDFSFLCVGSWWFWWESTFLFPQSRGSEKFHAPHRMVTGSIWPFPVTHVVGFFVGLCFHEQIGAQDVARREEFWQYQYRAFFSPGSEVPLARVPFSPSACDSPHLWFHHHLILDCRELILDLFFLTCRNILFCNLSSVLRC